MKHQLVITDKAGDNSRAEGLKGQEPLLMRAFSLGPAATFLARTPVSTPGCAGAGRCRCEGCAAAVPTLLSGHLHLPPAGQGFALGCLCTLKIEKQYGMASRRGAGKR